MKHRSLWKMFFLIIITLSLYGVYWTYKTKQEMNENHGAKIPTFAYYLTPLFMVFIVAPFALVAGEDIGIFLVAGAMTIGGFISLWWLWQYCKAADTVTKGQLPTALGFILFLFADEFAPLVAQSFYNKLPEKEPTSIPTVPNDPLITT